jgi:hypothetical protein
VCISLPIVSSSIGYYDDGLLLYGYFGWKNELLSLGTLNKRCKWSKVSSTCVYPLLHMVFVVWSSCSTFFFFFSMHCYNPCGVVSNGTSFIQVTFWGMGTSWILWSDLVLKLECDLKMV